MVKVNPSSHHGLDRKYRPWRRGKSAAAAVVLSTDGARGPTLSTSKDKDDYDHHMIKQQKVTKTSTKKKTSSSLKHQLRGQERLLKRFLQEQQQAEEKDEEEEEQKKNKKNGDEKVVTTVSYSTTSTTTSTAIHTVQIKIQQLKELIEQQQQKQLERLHAMKSHRIRFLERQKLVRMYKKLISSSKKQQQSSQQQPSSSVLAAGATATATATAAAIPIALDLIYVGHYPLQHLRYRPLFRSSDGIRINPIDEDEQGWYKRCRARQLALEQLKYIWDVSLQQQQQQVGSSSSTTTTLVEQSSTRNTVTISTEYQQNSQENSHSDDDDDDDGDSNHDGIGKDNVHHNIKHSSKKNTRSNIEDDSHQLRSWITKEQYDLVRPFTMQQWTVAMEKHWFQQQQQHTQNTMKINMMDPSSNRIVRQGTMLPVVEDDDRFQTNLISSQIIAKAEEVDMELDHQSTTISTSIQHDDDNNNNTNYKDSDTNEHNDEDDETNDDDDSTNSRSDSSSSSSSENSREKQLVTSNKTDKEGQDKSIQIPNNKESSKLQSGAPEKGHDSDNDDSDEDSHDSSSSTDSNTDCDGGGSSSSNSGYDSRDNNEYNNQKNTMSRISTTKNLPSDDDYVRHDDADNGDMEKDDFFVVPKDHSNGTDTQTKDAFEKAIPMDNRKQHRQKRDFQLNDDNDDNNNRKKSKKNNYNNDYGNVGNKNYRKPFPQQPRLNRSGGTTQTAKYNNTIDQEGKLLSRQQERMRRWQKSHPYRNMSHHGGR